MGLPRYPCAVVLVPTCALAASLCRRFFALWRGRGGVLCGQSVQYAAAVFGDDGLFKKDFELLVREGDSVGQKAFKKPHATAKAFCPGVAFLCIVLLWIGLIANCLFVYKPFSAFRFSRCLLGKYYP